MFFILIGMHTVCKLSLSARICHNDDDVDGNAMIMIMVLFQNEVSFLKIHSEDRN